jgi:urea carboxylase
VKRIFFDASYLVMGLGDVYLGAPVATPIDPRHRLVTTKYNPARTWTPENAVGIGGAYLCIYGMEGPGGYQFVGRTIQMWNRFRVTHDFKPGKPWLLEFFDQLRFYPVSHDELEQFRQDFPAGRFNLKIEHDTFRLKDYQSFLTENETSIAEFKQQQQQAFNTEREKWKSEDKTQTFEEVDVIDDESATYIPAENEIVVKSPVTGSLWQLNVAEGDTVEKEKVMLVLESMKMEIQIKAPSAGTLLKVFTGEGSMISKGQNLLVIRNEHD